MTLCQYGLCGSEGVIQLEDGRIVCLVCYDAMYATTVSEMVEDEQHGKDFA